MADNIFIGQRIKKLVEQSPYSLTDFGKKIGLKNPNVQVHSWLKKKRYYIDEVLLAAELLKVPYFTLIEEKYSPTNSMVKEDQATYELKATILKDKEDLIASLRQTIDTQAETIRILKSTSSRKG